MILHRMTVLVLKQLFLYSIEIRASKEKKNNVEHTLHYLPQTRYSRLIEFFAQQFVRN